MPPTDAPKVVMVPVKRYDINILLEDILAPLTKMSASLDLDKAGAAAGTDIHQHVQQLSDLARQLHSVVDRINGADPKLLAPTPPKSS
jgi:hypothetical protein